MDRIVIDKVMNGYKISRQPCEAMESNIWVATTVDDVYEILVKLMEEKNND